MPKKKRVNNKSTGRDYSYDTKYQSSPEQIKNRVARNKARRQTKAALAKKHGKAKASKLMNGKDVDHKRPLSKGGSNAKSNRRLISKSKNRARK
jgi:hypothetical protein